MESRTNGDHGRLKHNPKSFESFDRKLSKKSPRGSMRRTLSLIPDVADSPSQFNCPCVTHPGREFINKIFNMNINYLFECLFEKNDFDSRFAQLTKKFEMKKSNWYVENGERLKKFEYKIEINNPFVNTKFCENSQIMKVLKSIPNELYVVETETRTTGVPYSDCFSVTTRFCLVKCDTNLTKLLVHAAMNFSSKPNFLIKNLIEKNGFASLTEHFAILCRSLEEESILKRNAPPPLAPFITTADDNHELVQGDDRASQDGYSSSSSSTPSSRSSVGSSYSPSISSESVLSSEEISIAVKSTGEAPMTVEKISRKSHSEERVRVKERRKNELDRPVVFQSNSDYFNPHVPGSTTSQYPCIVLSPEFFVKAFFVLMMVLVVFNLILFVKLANIESITHHIINKHKK